VLYGVCADLAGGQLTLVAASGNISANIPFASAAAPAFAHIALSILGTAVRFYVDGRFILEAQLLAPLLESASGAVLLGWTPGECFVCSFLVLFCSIFSLNQSYFIPKSQGFRPFLERSRTSGSSGRR
jgi:hypothetical protein